MTKQHSRRQRACDLLTRAGLGAAAFVPGANFAYLTGVHLHLMERPTLFVLTRDGGTCAVMPALERLKWSSAMPQCETFYWDDADGPAAAFERLADALGATAPLGVEGLRMRAAEFLALGRHWGANGLVDADGVLSDLRLLKDDDEIADLRRAIAISEAALGDLYDAGIAGRTERELAGQLKAAMLAHGASGLAFDPIVLTGGEAANPHGDPGERAVQAGDPLLIDFGASYGDSMPTSPEPSFAGMQAIRMRRSTRPCWRRMQPDATRSRSAPRSVRSTRRQRMSWRRRRSRT